MKKPRRQEFSLFSYMVVVVLGLGCRAPLASSFAGTDSEVVRVIDFTEKPHGSAVEWLQENGYDLRLDAESLNPRFSEKGLVLSTDGRTAGLMEREIELSDVGQIRVTWGVEEYPKGADWEDGVYRVPIAIMVSFGDKEIGSGSMFVPDAPYFISLFLSRNAEPDKAYTANYYEKGGRYFCQPCTPPEGKTVTTEFDLYSAFRNQFDKSEVPPITGFGIQMNTNDTRGGARAYLERVEFIKR
ncbi:MAG: hypothetical protein U5S82_15335 [Gammaproteobacteria bacterium]|nr:hypothetical protein [Gammaproteobacteria bacterium]